MSEHPRIIVLNGLRRSGTSIVWNILESHPSVCSPLGETGEIIYRELLKWLPALPTKLIVRTALTWSGAPLTLARRFDGAIKKALWAGKLANIKDPDNRFKYEGVPYSPEEIASAVLCLKSVNLDTFLVGYFARHYDDVRFIGLIRNGYAILDGAMRHGDTAEKAGRDYLRVGQRMIRDAREQSKYLLLKFEDVLEDPFAAAARLYEFTGLEPVELQKLRLKSKRVLSRDGRHEVRFGDEDRKYWFDREQIWSILDKGINRTQLDRLSAKDVRTFERHASPVLEHFGYAAQE